MEQNQEAKVKLEKAQALLRANNIEFDAGEFALSEPSATALDKHLSNAPYHHEATFCHSMANKSQQALNAVLHNVIPVLDQSLSHNLASSLGSLNSNITELNKLLANMTTALVNSNNKDKQSSKPLSVTKKAQ